MILTRPGSGRGIPMNNSDSTVALIQAAIPTLQAMHWDKVKREAWIGDRLLSAALGLELRGQTVRFSTARRMADLAADILSNRVLSRLCEPHPQMPIWHRATYTEAAVSLIYAEHGMDPVREIVRCLLAQRPDCAP